MSADGAPLRLVTEFRCLARFDGESELVKDTTPLPEDPQELRKCAASLRARLLDLQGFLKNPACRVLLVASDGTPPSRWERVAYHVE